MSNSANHRVRESCLICEGKGRYAGVACTYCAGTGIVFSRTGVAEQVIVMTGDCKVPARLKQKEAVHGA